MTTDPVNTLFDFQGSAPQSSVKNGKTQWEASKATLKQAVTGVGGIKQIGAGVTLSKLASSSQDFTDWSSIDVINLDQLSYEDPDLGVFKASGNVSVVLAGQNSTLRGWRFILKNIGLTVPYLQLKGQAIYEYTTKNSDYQGLPVYVFRPQDKTADTISLTGVGLLTNLQVGATVNKIVYSRDSNKGQLVVNSADVAGRLDVSEKDIFSFNSDIALKYVRNDKTYGNASTLTLSDVEIKSGLLKSWFSGSLQATDVVVQAADQSIEGSGKWELLKGTLNGTLAVDFGGILDGSGAAKIVYEKSNTTSQSGRGQET